MVPSDKAEGGMHSLNAERFDQVLLDLEHFHGFSDVLANDVLHAFVECFGTHYLEDCDQIVEAWYGHYNSVEEFLRANVVDALDISQEMVDYLDFDKLARTYFDHTYVRSSDGHVFCG